MAGPRFATSHLVHTCSLILNYTDHRFLQFYHEAIGKALGKSKDAARMQIIRLLKDIGDFIKDQEDLLQYDQPEREKTPANQKGPKNDTQDDDTPVKASDMKDI